MSPDEMIAVIQAYKEGKKIEYWSAVADDWLPVTPFPTWNFYREKYRVKPEPKPDVVKTYAVLSSGTVWLADEQAPDLRNLRLTFDGETVRLKSEEVI
jgi:hypothetical protein